jgi:hypothetical protein
MSLKDATQALVALMGMAGLVGITVLALSDPGLTDQRDILVGGLIAAASTSAAWLFGKANGVINGRK